MKKILAFLMVFLLLFTSQSFVIGEEISDYAIMINIDYRKHIVQYTYMDQDDQIVSGPYGYAIIECQYEGNREYPFKIRYLDAKGNRVNNPDGYSVVKFNYDGQGRLTEATFYGTDGKIKNTTIGYARVRIQYENGNMNRATFYTADKKTISDEDLTLTASIFDWITEDGKPKLPYEDFPLNMDWNPTPASELTLQGYVMATVDVNMRREPKYSSIIGKIKEGTVVPYYGTTVAGTGITWYCVEDENQRRGYVNSKYLHPCNEDGSDIVITPEPTETLTPSPEPTAEPTATSTMTPTMIPTEEPSPEPTDTPTPSPELTNTPTLAPTDTPEATATSTPSPTPTPRTVYTVIWENEDGTRLDQKTYEEGEEEPATRVIPEKKENAEKTYIFAGWNAETTDGTVTIYKPRFSAIPKTTITVIWLNGDDSLLDIRTYIEGSEEPVTDKIPVKNADGEYTYNFTGWDEGTQESTTKIYKPLFEAIPVLTPTPIPTVTPTPSPVPTPTPIPEPELRLDPLESDRGNIVRESYFDYTGHRVVGEEGFATRVREMNKDKVIAESWYDTEGNPMTIGDTYYRVEYTYDKIGNINREKYFDIDGKPIRCLAGYAIVYREFDAYNRIIYEKYYDTDGFAIMLEDGAVSRRFEYNDDGELIRTTKYDYGDHEVE